MSSIVAGHFPHLPPTAAPVGAGAKVPDRTGRELPRPPAAEPVLAPVRSRIMEYVERTISANGQGPTLAQVEAYLGGEPLLAQQQVYWLEGSGYLRADRVDGGRRCLRPTHKEYKP